MSQVKGKGLLAFRLCMFVTCMAEFNIKIDRKNRIRKEQGQGTFESYYLRSTILRLCDVIAYRVST